MRRVGSGIALLLLALPACNQSDSRSSGPAVRDSAGVRIVENGKTQSAEWQVGAAPIFILGWESDGPMFTWLQSGHITPDGGALIGDFRAGTIFRIGPGGSVVAAWGRKGEGPGEYQGLDAILLRGDSIMVSDGRLRRLTLLSKDGEVLATRPLAGGFLHQVSAVMADGRLLLVPGDGYGSVSDLRPEWVFERQPIMAATLVGNGVDTLANLPHLRRWYGTRAASPGPISVKGRAAGYADGFAWSRSDEPEVRWYDSDGQLVRIARWEEKPKPLSSEWRRRMAASLEESYRTRGAEEGVISARIIELEEELDRHQAGLPYWDEFHVDRQGNAWLREYSPPGDPSPRWRVVGYDGRLVGWIEVPDVVSILDITEDRILGVRFDELDVPAVVMLELRK